MPDGFRTEISRRFPGLSICLARCSPIWWAAAPLTELLYDIYAFTNSGAWRRQLQFGLEATFLLRSILFVKAFYDFLSRPCRQPARGCRPTRSPPR